MTRPRFPYWWQNFDAFHSVDADYEEPVMVDGLALKGRGVAHPLPTCLRWDYADDRIHAHILDGNWKGELPYNRFGWVVGFTPGALRFVPHYDGFWYSSGEATSFAEAAKQMLASARQARTMVIRKENT